MATVVGEERKRGRGQPRKTLNQLVQDGTFEARRPHHRELLDTSPFAADRDLRAIQAEYQQTRNEFERYAVARRFEALVRELAEEIESLHEEQMAELRKVLGPRGTSESVINLFRYYIRLENGDPWILDPLQEEALHDLYRRDVNGQRIYKVILFGFARGFAKTPIATGVSLDALLGPPEGVKPRIFQGAGDREQAKIGLEYADFWINGDDDHPPTDLARWLRVKGNRIVSGRGSYRILSSEGRLSHGRKPTAAILDEVWLFKDEKHRQLYSGMQTALPKERDAFLLMITTAGFAKDSLLGEIYTAAMDSPYKETRLDGCLTIVRNEEAGFLMWWLGAPENIDPEDLTREELTELVRKVNPGSWVNVRDIVRAYYSESADKLEWRRLHLNQWTTVKGAWLPTGVWTRMSSDVQIPAGGTIYVGVDAAHSYDATAVAWAWKAPDGKVVVKSRVWSLRESTPAHEHVGADALDNEQLVEPFIHQLAKQYRIKEIVYDPRYFGTEGRHLSEHFPTAPIHPSSGPMIEAVQEFYKACLGGMIAHDGDPVLRDHVNAVAGRKTEDGYWQIKKLRQAAPIDACVAAILAHSRAARESGRSVYEDRGLLVL